MKQEFRCIRCKKAVTEYREDYVETTEGCLCSHCFEEVIEFEDPDTADAYEYVRIGNNS